MAFKIPFFFNDTATDKGSAWSADAIINSSAVHVHHGYMDEVYYSPINNVGSDSTSALADDHLYASPIRIEHEVTVTRLGFEVTTAHTGAADALIGLYTADISTGKPSTLIVSSSEISVASTGEKEATISQVLTPGAYWMVFSLEDDDTSGVQFVVHTSSNSIQPEFGAFAGTPGGAAIRVSRTYDGTLPASFPAIAITDFDQSTHPHLWWRKGV